jgi:hypothetical protein
MHRNGQWIGVYRGPNRAAYGAPPGPIGDAMEARLDRVKDAPSTLLFRTFSCVKAAVFQTVAVVEFARKIARSRNDDSRTLGTLREKGRESEGR